MVHIVHVILYLLVNIAGFLMIHVVPDIARQLHLYPDYISEVRREALNRAYYTSAFLGLILGTAASTVYFMVNKKNRELRTWLLLAPLYMTFICAMGVILYFKFFR